MEKIIRLLISGICGILLIPGAVLADKPIDEWRYDGGYEDSASKVAVDSFGNVYVAGSSRGATGYDYVIVKYDDKGKELWVKRYDGGSDDYVNALVVDSTGAYISGKSYSPAGGNDFLTVKYDTAGNELWAGRYDGSYDDSTVALAVDTAGNVYVGGTSNLDYAIIKYDNAGNEVWVRRYDGGEQDHVAGLAIDSVGNVYITGTTRQGPLVGGWYANHGYTTIKYDANGNELWNKRYTTEGYGVGATAIAVDPAGNVYVTGGNNWDPTTVKYDTNGNEVWVERLGFNPIELVVDSVGNIYIIGVHYYQDSWVSNYATIKYDINGNELWSRVKNFGSPSYATALAVDLSGNVYVTGSVTPRPSDDATIKYDANGNELWVERYEGACDKYRGVNACDAGASASDISVDSLGNVYVTGTSYSRKGGYDFTTIKYDNSSKLQQTK